MIARREVLLGLSAQAVVAGSLSPQFDNDASLKSYRAAALYVPRRDGLAEACRTAEGLQSWGQVYAQWLATTGDVRGAWLARRRAFGAAPLAPAADLEGIRAENALQAIIRASEGRRMVVINDDHFTSLTRAFAHRVALSLAQFGFSLLAAETFTSADPAFLRFASGQAPVTTGVGYYSGDPVYAQMLRDLREQGWRFAAYEAREDQANLVRTGAGAPDAFSSREEAQARNLAELAHRNPNTRVLVFCGHGHAFRSELQGRPYMGARLVRMGLRPLVIDQTAGLPAPEGEAGSAFGEAVLARFLPTQPIAVCRANGAPLRRPAQDAAAIDIAVHHPRLANSSGRPGWLAAAPGRRAVEVDLPKGLPKAALVSAVLQDDAAVASDAIPMDQYPLAIEDTRRARFLLPSGAYLMRVETTEGRRDLSRFVF